MWSGISLSGFPFVEIGGRERRNLTKLPAGTIHQARALRGGTDSWLLATFLLLFGAALVASVPASPGVPSSLRGHSSQDAQRAASTANPERGVVRAQSRVVRAVQPKGAGGGVDLLAVCMVDIACIGAPREIFAADVSIDARVAPRAFHARAPPLLTA